VTIADSLQENILLTDMNKFAAACTTLGDGFITADELKVEMSGSSANVTEMIKQADKNGVSHLL
jgi:hypothetical protein